MESSLYSLISLTAPLSTRNWLRVSQPSVDTCDGKKFLSFQYSATRPGQQLFRHNRLSIKSVDDRDEGAPGPLPGYAPIWSPLNCPPESLHSAFRLNFYPLHSFQSLLPQFVRPYKPLLGASQNDWLLGSPIIWI